MDEQGNPRVMFVGGVDTIPVGVWLNAKEAISTNVKGMSVFLLFLPAVGVTGNMKNTQWVNPTIVSDPKNGVKR